MSANPAIGDHIEQEYGLDCQNESYASATCGVEFATFLADSKRDQLQHVPGNNTITTHSIGFNVDYNWVPRVAAAGSGVYAPAASAQDLIDAFNDILDSVEIESAASAPSISVNAFNTMTNYITPFFSHTENQDGMAISRSTGSSKER